MSTKNKTEAAKILIAKICDEYGNGNFIFRGTTEIFSGNPNGVNSSLYRWVEGKDVINEHHKLPQIEKEIVEKARKHFPDKASNIEILTDIRHYGGKVNLIDFTRSIYAALFFACNGKFDNDGEIIFWDTKQLPPIKDIEYSNLKDERMIESAKTQASQLRVVAQDSIFVYYVEGYIEKSHFKNEKIPKELKKNILNIIKKFSNIDQNTVYNDLIGFIANEENYKTAESLFYQGNAKVSLGDNEEAIECYTTAIELNPQFAEAYCNRGNAKFSLDYNEKAIEDYNKAISLNPKLADAYNNRGYLKSLLGKNEEAIQDYTTAIELNPQYAEAYCNRGNAKYLLGKNEEAIQDFSQAIKSNPQYADAYNNRGYAKSSLGEYEEAIRDCTKAIEINPKLAKAYNNRGNAKGKLGDTTGAEADLAKAKELKEQQKKK